MTLLITDPRERAAVRAECRLRAHAWQDQATRALTSTDAYACRMRACVLQQLATDLEDEDLERRKWPAFGPRRIRGIDGAL